ncbi:hypothetical protein [Halalkalibacter urbisdiaboli]|uniref:hypothetical protein n=1 Tax=Halalkalibacter urbisdiaboli TaxID=1960589 RepID=UPI000B42E332|nr:hypothetical protein [Halalkalibacter urbisdiaboli]
MFRMWEALCILAQPFLLFDTFEAVPESLHLIAVSMTFFLILLGSVLLQHQNSPTIKDGTATPTASSVTIFVESTFNMQTNLQFFYFALHVQ